MNVNIMSMGAHLLILNTKKNIAFVSKWLVYEHHQHLEVLQGLTQLATLLI